jgi:hypothetical protein
MENRNKFHCSLIMIYVNNNEISLNHILIEIVVNINIKQIITSSKYYLK